MQERGVIVKLFTALCAFVLSSTLLAAGKATHVMLVVWDGMRPDFVSEQTTPTLVKLAREGVAFVNHHAVYVSSTEVNGTALATGAYPEQSGVIGNTEFRQGINSRRSINTAARAAVARGDEVGHFLGFPTVAEVLHAEGLRSVTAGAKTVTLLADRRAGTEDGLGINLFEGNVLPKSFATEIKEAIGGFPPVGLPKLERDLWTTRALIGPLWSREVPAFSLLWLSEPDYSQHATGPGSKTSLQAIKGSDENLGRVLASLNEKGLRDQTDVIVVSDHGFSTIIEDVDLAERLGANGFRAFREFPSEGAQNGDILVVGNGGTAFLYITGHEPALVDKVAHWLQGQPFCGAVFSRISVEGTFSLAQGRINSKEAPDIAVSLRWTGERSKNGTPGMVYTELSEYGPGQGMHASLSRFDLHNICFAMGPDFRKAFQDELPSGNIDIAPTILAILGVTPKTGLSGRILAEALVQPGLRVPSATTHRLEASYRGENSVWHQYLQYSEVNGVVYFEEGNGKQEAAENAPSN